MISLTVNANLVAQVQQVRMCLREAVGGHELQVTLSVTATPVKTCARWFTVQSARIEVGPAGREMRPFGVARPDAEFRLEQHDNSVFPRACELSLPLNERHIRALDDLRNDGDLRFNLKLIGFGGDADGHEGVSPFEQEIQHVLARSDWIGQLNASGAANIAMFEVALPVGVGDADNQPFGMLRRAQQHFLNGRYDDAVGACRLVLEKLGVPKQGGSITLDQTTPQPERMTLFAQILRHTTHHPHHARPETEQHRFTRAEARMIVQMTAVYAGYVAARE